jgi:Family of unknown function (DUF6624)
MLMAASRALIGTAYLALALLAVQARAQDADLAAKCPDAVREKVELQGRAPPRPIPTAVTRPALRQNLLLMARQDQEVRAHLRLTGSRIDLATPEGRRLREVDSSNLKRLKDIVAQDGFPSAEMVGLDGVDAAWLLTVHGAADPDFQEEVLKLTVGHARRGEIQSNQVAMLTDDLLQGRGKKQRYGTNYELRDGQLYPAPIEDAANVDARRREIGLISLANDTCVARALSSTPPTQ